MRINIGVKQWPKFLLTFDALQLFIVIILDRYFVSCFSLVNGRYPSRMNRQANLKRWVSQATDWTSAKILSIKYPKLTVFWILVAVNHTDEIAIVTPRSGVRLGNELDRVTKATKGELVAICDAHRFRLGANQCSRDATICNLYRLVDSELAWLSIPIEGLDVIW